MSSDRGALRALRVAALLLAVWMAFFGLEATMSAALSPNPSGSHRALFEIDFAIAVLWASFSPFIALWHKHARASAVTLVGLIALHVPLLVVASLVDCAFTRWLVIVVTGAPPAVAFAATLVHYADFDLVSYFAVVAVAEALLVRRAGVARARIAQRLETSLGRARLEYLETQLQPHFLFNSLGAVSELAFDAPATAHRVLQHLISIFRTALATKSDEITLGEEILGIEPYLDIQRIRFADWLSIEYDIDDGAVDCVLPRFVLQPLVENAIRHGLSGRNAPGTIVISAAVNDGVLKVRVTDNGVGLVSSSGSSGRGIGLTNVRDRLAILYGDDERLRLMSNATGGAIAELTIPARRRPTASADEVPGAVAISDAELRSLRVPTLLQRPVVAIGVSWFAFGLLWTQQSYVYDMIRGPAGSRSFVQIAGVDMTSAFIWALLTPVVLAVARRYPLRRGNAMLGGLAYLIAGMFTTFVHGAAFQQTTARTIPLASPQWEDTFAVGFVIFMILITIGHREVFLEWLHEREADAVALTAELAEAQNRATSLRTIPVVLLDALDGIAATVRRDPSLTERQLTRLADYLRLALECGDARGLTPERKNALDAAVVALRDIGAHSENSTLSQTLTRSA
ncbi:MAG: histidine kinase [Gemmatimonadaceae bacterium]